MEFLSRLLGGAYAPQKPATRSAAHDPQSRLLRFRRVWNHVIELCNRPRNPETEAPLFEQLSVALDRVAGLIRDESRAPSPHLCLSYAASAHIYVPIARAAAVSQHAPIIHSTIGVFAALVDSEEEDFLSSDPFAKSLMRLVKRVEESNTIEIGTETATAILELLFTIAAKIRLQPSILPVWFQSKSKAAGEVTGIDEKKRFVGSAQKDDFPLCYLLIGRVHHEGRLGDFARTGLLYIFEATGRSAELEGWVLSSDLPTLMASGLGALYSQLSRELSILHPDSTLPAVLAMSDYSTTHSRATTESAFSKSHESHMATFLSYLAFWQDVLDHCRSAEVKQTLVDHFQILFLQQLLYPSLLQSSDTDAGSSVAVLTYMTAMLEALEYPDLIHMMLVYLLNIQADNMIESMASLQTIRCLNNAPSPSALKRRQSILLVAGPRDIEEMVEPTLFSLVDLLLNSISSQNSQTVFAALKLVSTLLQRQRPYVFGTVLKTERISSNAQLRTAGLLETEIEIYSKLCLYHDTTLAQSSLLRLCEDIRPVFESQLSWETPTVQPKTSSQIESMNNCTLPPSDLLLGALNDLLGTFLTNSVDVNLALTQAIMSVALSAEIRLDGWLALEPSNRNKNLVSEPEYSWQVHLDADELQASKQVRQAYQHDLQVEDHPPLLYTTLARVKSQVSSIEAVVTNLQQLLQARRDMIQGSNMDLPPDDDVTHVKQDPKATSDRLQRGTSDTKHAGRSAMSRSSSQTGPQEPRPSQSLGASVFQPPPPETPSTTDVLMQKIVLESDGVVEADTESGHSATLNHILTNLVILQDFIWEIIALLQVRAAVLGPRELCFACDA